MSGCKPDAVRTLGWSGERFDSSTTHHFTCSRIASLTCNELKAKTRDLKFDAPAGAEIKTTHKDRLPHTVLQMPTGKNVGRFRKGFNSPAVFQIASHIMRYVRFESQAPCEGTNSRLGIFQIAFMVRDAHETSRHDSHEISRQIEWLKSHLQSPDELRDPQNYRAICWFKDTAHEPMKRIWAIKPCVEAYGYWIDIVKTWTPGQIIYEDGWQVAAKPWRGKRG